MPRVDVEAEEVARDFTTLTQDRPGLFDEMAAAVFAFQSSRNVVYSRYCTSLDGALGDVPFLPVQAFKHAAVTCFPSEEAEHVFESSGTGQGGPSRHYVYDLSVYERAVSTHFRAVFGDGPHLIAAHLPRYVEKGERSSLLYMVEHLIRQHGTIPAETAFFLEDLSPLRTSVERCQERGERIILFGAAFGLLELVERGGVHLPAESIVVETGGMKTYRREVDRSDLHARLAEGFGLERTHIWSEYGMCELMSQCYTRGEDAFYPPPWMRFKVLDPDNPAVELADGEPGALALFDLGNVYTVSAVLTQDRAIRRGGGFEVLGRLTGAELRGCNFLLEHV